LRAVATGVQNSERVHAVSAGGIEIERKYLLPGPPPASVLEAATPYDIEQTYLTAPSGTRRVRRLVGPDGEHFWLNEKQALGGISRREDEREVSAEEYRALLEEADPRSGTVLKTRHVIGHGEQMIELDIFAAPAGLVLLEVELRSEDEAVDLPAWAAGAVDVSEDPAYTNAQIARRLGGAATS
jgi:CYTH domain-containing protein